MKKSMFIVNFKTYEKLNKGKGHMFAWWVPDKGRKVKLPMQFSAYPPDNIAFVIVRGEYKGAYRLKFKKGKKRGSSK